MDRMVVSRMAHENTGNCLDVFDCPLCGVGLLCRLCHTHQQARGACDKCEQCPSCSGLVLSLCDFTGNMVKPWADAGYECMCVDIKHGDKPVKRGRITFVGADVTDWLPPKRAYKIVFAFPPCTDLAISGARWFKDKGIGRLADALRVVEACRKICEWSESPYMIENPVSSLSTYWREPDYTFNPCDYGGYLNPPGDAYTKRTCLWTGGGFRMPEQKPVPATAGSKMHLMPPSKDRAALRSETPPGFANAVYEANRKAIWEYQEALDL